jgi:3-isopropylmalate/(R)-2-methylmalate dehydratase small subunit
MQPFTVLDGIAAPIGEANIDTNQLCPTRFNRVPVGPGHERVLFHDRRFHADGSEREDFILNQPTYRETRILVGDRNFGCGSSREPAVKALQSFGVRSVIASSYGDIFFSNSLKNGLLPVTLPPRELSELRDYLTAHPGVEATVDLENKRVSVANGPAYNFEIDELIREKLLLGLDDIGLTERVVSDLSEFESRHYAASPWLKREQVA